jgi:hypothetical protein
MERLDKSFIREVASSGLPVIGVLPGGSATDFATLIIFPEGIEDQFPEVPSAKKELIQMREELKQWIIDHHPFPDMYPVLVHSNTYLIRTYKLVGKENYDKAIQGLKSVKEFRETVGININLNKKLGEYQQRFCASCNKTGPWRLCSRCKKVYYCSVECQKKNWPTHKLDCH